MGEVYEADDLTLGQVVALKFLPPELRADDEALKHLFDEVRIARRVSHPNVTRVYDIGEVDERHFLTMEFVRGEDLSELLKRIGRLPVEKAIEIAHQICAGLAAAHDQGVLHRDLKPANVLLDADGKVRLTDFGLAILTHDQEGGIAGTPAYMAPEQIRGEKLTVRSEVYALGLLLFELVTGKRAFESSTFEDYTRLHEREPAPEPSSLVDNLDPQIERVILQCLEKDPAHRPPSAHAVSAALPGGDPLATALATGHTPAPELVAAAGSTGLLRPGVVAGLAVLCCALAAVAIWFRSMTDRWTVVGLEKSPDVLVERAQSLIEDIGYRDTPEDYGHWFSQNRVEGTASFTYRESPKVLRFVGENLSVSDPAPTTPGMIEVSLETDGTLRQLFVVPEIAPVNEEPALDFDWAILLEAAGLDPTMVEPTAPRTSRAFADRNLAWTVGPIDDPEAISRIDAASLHGRPVGFRKWIDTGTPASRQRITPPAIDIAFLLLLAGTSLLTVFMAWRNVRLGRGDRRGAMRIAMFTFIVGWTGAMLGGDHINGSANIENVIRITGVAVFVAVMTWIGYLAFEPFVRRKWPHVLISWTRLIACRFNDPLVGRDLLVGVTCGTGLLVLADTARLLPVWTGDSPAALVWSPAGALGSRQAIGALGLSPIMGIFFAMLCVLTIAFLRRLIGRAGLAVWVLGLAPFVVNAIRFNSGGAYSPVLTGIYAVLLGIVLVTVLIRCGLLALAVTLTITGGAFRIPLTLDPSSWYFHNAVFVALLLLGLTAWGLRASLAGRSMFKEET